MTPARLTIAALALLAAAAAARAQDPPATAEQKGEALLEAVAQGDAAAAKRLLEQGAPVRARSRQGARTALHLAAERGDLAIVELLIVHGAELAALDAEPEAPVGAASRKGHAPVVRALLARNAGPAAVPVALTNAVVRDDAAVLQVVRATNRAAAEDLSMALDLALRRGSKKAAEALRQAGVAPAQPAAGIAPGIISRYAGRYTADTSALTFTVKDGSLHVAGASGPAAVRLLPLAVRYFVADGAEAFRVRFDVPPPGGAQTATLRLIGSERTYRREPETRP